MDSLIKLFFNSNGDFQWQSLTAVSVIASIIFSIMTLIKQNKTLKLQEKLSKDKISADVKSKSRIIWIQDVRGLTAELLTSYNKYFDYDENTHYYDLNKTVKDYSFNYSNYISEISTKSNKLMLYFSNADKKDKVKLNLMGELSYKDKNDEESIKKIKKVNEEILKFLYNTDDNSLKNDLLSEFIKQLNTCVKNVSHSYTKQSENTIEKNKEMINGYLSELQNTISIYLKIEWDIAKEGR